MTDFVQKLVGVGPYGEAEVRAGMEAALKDGELYSTGGDMINHT